MERLICPVCGKGKIKAWNQRAFSRHYATHKVGPIYENIKNKICIRCKRLLPLENFRRLRKKSQWKYFNSYCYECEKKKNLEYIKEHPEWSRKNNQLGHFKWKMKVTGGSCQICGEDRTLDVAHIVPRLGKDRRRLEPEDNLLGLCPTHHRLFDENKLSEDEYGKIKNRIEQAKRKYATL